MKYETVVHRVGRSVDGGWWNRGGPRGGRRGGAVAGRRAEGAVIAIGGQRITVAKDGLTFAVTTKLALPVVGKAPVLPPNKNVPKPVAEGEQGE